MSDPRGFVPIPEINDALKLVRDACKLGSSATTWTRDQGVVVSARLGGFDFNQKTFSLKLPEGLDPRDFQDRMTRDPAIFISCKTHDQTLFFKVTFSAIDPSQGLVILGLPESVYRAQQRKHPRALVKDRRDIRLTHPDPANRNRTLERRVYDLSLGGASLVLFYGEERHYHVRQRLEAITLELAGLTIKTWGLVRHLQVFPPDSAMQGVQLGVEFFNLGPVEKKAITTLVEEEIRRQFAAVEG